MSSKFVFMSSSSRPSAFISGFSTRLLRLRVHRVEIHGLGRCLRLLPNAYIESWGVRQITQAARGNPALCRRSLVTEMGNEAAGSSIEPARSLERIFWRGWSQFRIQLFCDHFGLTKIGSLVRGSTIKQHSAWIHVKSVLEMNRVGVLYEQRLSFLCFCVISTGYVDFRPRGHFSAPNL